MLETTLRADTFQTHLYTSAQYASRSLALQKLLPTTKVNVRKTICELVIALPYSFVRPNILEEKTLIVLYLRSCQS